MSILPANLLSQFPRVPKEASGLLRWAQNLIAALDARDSISANSVYTPAYTGTVSFSNATSNVLKLTTTSAIGDATINTKPGKVGPYWLIITNDASAGRTITFGTGFASAGNLVGTASKTAVVAFISDGTTLYEVARKTGL